MTNETPTDEDRIEEIREQLHGWIDSCLDDGEYELTMERPGRWETSWSGESAYVVTSPPHYEFDMFSDDVHLSIEADVINSGETVGEDAADWRSNILDLEASDDWDGEVCPECDTEFNANIWELDSHVGDEYGGMAIHECPKPHCEGEAHIHY